MNLNEKIMKFLKIHFSSTVNLIDGTSLQIEGDLNTGSKVSVITQDGNIALPDGEYKLEDESIIITKDGIIMDIIKADVEAEAPVEMVEEKPIEEEVVPIEEEPIIEEVEEPLELQKENPDVSGEEPTLIPEVSGTTITEELPEEMVEVPVETPVEEVEPIEPEDMKIKELEDKIAKLESILDELMAKMNMMSEKFSAAQPIVRMASDNKMVIDTKLQSKVDLINRLKQK